MQEKGLTTQQAQAKRTQFGPNRVETKKQNPLVAFVKWLLSPISLMLLAAAILSVISVRYADAAIIMILFFTNFGIKLWHEHKADSATKLLQERMDTQLQVLRDGEWVELSSTELVPGDLIELVVGTIVPADVTLIDTKNVSINESMITGESLPVEKRDNDTAFSGSFLSTGFAHAKVDHTGVHTKFGKTLSESVNIRKRSLLEQDILTISKFLSVISIAMMIGLTIVLVLTGEPFLDVVTLDLSLLIAGIPVALPTVMSLIISIGVLELAKEHVIVRRLSSLEDLSNVNLLLSDKTGTLTENKIHIEHIEQLAQYDQRTLLALAQSNAANEQYNAIDAAVLEAAKQQKVRSFPRSDVIPGDSVRKRSTSFITYDDTPMVVSFGAPHTLAQLCDFTDAQQQAFNDVLHKGGEEGKRMLALAVADGQKEEHMLMVGVFMLADAVRSEASEVVSFLSKQGVTVKMITGDTREVGVSVAHSIGLDGQVVQRDVFDDTSTFASKLADTSVFTEVLPEDKLYAVQTAKDNFVVAVTGDGVNDIPAIKAADVGIGVRNAVSALRNTADIVLLSDGIAVIKDAIIEARKVFARVYNYSVYRMSESFRLIITIAVIGFLYKTYPLTPVQIILLSVLNDVPIISLAFDRVKAAAKPAHINAKERALLSGLFGCVGIVNSLLMLLIVDNFLHMEWSQIQTVFFLKLAVSGHMLVYVAHTHERWYKFLPSKEVIAATSITQVIATTLALTGVFTASISWQMALFIWVWSFFWMQIGELIKILKAHFFEAAPEAQHV